LLAWSWKDAIKEGKPNIKSAIFPMTKAVVRAMDTTTDYIKNAFSREVDKFIVAGASKWG